MEITDSTDSPIATADDNSVKPETQVVATYDNPDTGAPETVIASGGDGSGDPPTTSETPSSLSAGDGLTNSPQPSVNGATQNLSIVDKFSDPNTSNDVTSAGAGESVSPEAPAATIPVGTTAETQVSSFVLAPAAPSTPIPAGVDLPDLPAGLKLDVATPSIVPQLPVGTSASGASTLAPAEPTVPITPAVADGAAPPIGSANSVVTTTAVLSSTLGGNSITSGVPSTNNTAIFSGSGASSADFLQTNSNVTGQELVTGTTALGTTDAAPSTPIGPVQVNNAIPTNTSAPALPPADTTLGLKLPAAAVETLTASGGGTDMKSILLPEMAPGRPSSTDELKTLLANGGRAENITPSEAVRLGAAGVNLTELGLPQSTIEALPTKVSEPTIAQLGAGGAAVGDFLANAGGNVADLLGNDKVNGSTLGTVFPAKLGLNSDGSYKTASDGVNDMGLKSQSFAGPGASDASLLALEQNKKTVSLASKTAGPMPDQPSARDIAAGIYRTGEKNVDTAAAAYWNTQLNRRHRENDVFPAVAHTIAPKGPLDNNPNFTKGVDAAAEVYRSNRAGSEQTYVVTTQASEMVPVSKRDTEASPAVPNPRIPVQDQDKWWTDINGGNASNSIARPGNIAAMVNTQYFNVYKQDTTMSLPFAENGVIGATGGIEPKEKIAMKWNNDPGSKVEFSPWKENTGTYAVTGKDWFQNDKKVKMQQSYETTAAAANLGSKDNLLVGFKPELDNKTREPQTMVGLNSKTGKVGWLVSADKLTQKEGVQVLKDGGFDQFIRMDSGPSSALAVKNNATGRGDPLVVSPERRAIPKVLAIMKPGSVNRAPQ